MVCPSHACGEKALIVTVKILPLVDVTAGLRGQPRAPLPSGRVLVDCTTFPVESRNCNFQNVDTGLGTWWYPRKRKGYRRSCHPSLPAA